MPRPTTATAEGLSLLAPYWTSIVGARAQGLRSSDVWGIITDIFQEGGPAFQGASIFDMNQMWRQAGELLNAEASFGSAPRDVPVTSEMWAWAPWAAPTTAAWQTPNYMVNYAHAALDAEGNILLDEAGNPIPVWGATDWQGSLDVTTGDVDNYILASAQASLDTGSPGAMRQMEAIGGAAIGPLLSVQIMRF